MLVHAGPHRATTTTRIRTYGAFRVANQPLVHVVGLREEAGVLAVRRQPSRHCVTYIEWQ